MEPIRIAAAQFEHRSGDPAYNLEVIERLTQQAAEQGAHAIAFHELCITGYTFLKDLSRQQLEQLAEPVPGGSSVQKLMEISQRYQITVLAGVLEQEGKALYNTYVAVEGTALKAHARKLHPFISKHLSAGDAYTTFELGGWTCGILICYDNNVIENVRATTLLGANMIFAPHVTMCTPSPMPGRGYVDPALWENREQDPVPLRKEFDGPKGREWLMRWLPARAYDNGVYYVFSNPIGMDGDQLKNGNSLLLDPYGEILAEIRSFKDEMTMATFIPEKLTLAGGYRYRNARRPELYRDILGQDNEAHTEPIWLKN